MTKITSSCRAKAPCAFSELTIAHMIQRLKGWIGIKDRETRHKQ